MLLSSPVALSQELKGVRGNDRVEEPDLVKRFGQKRINRDRAGLAGAVWAALGSGAV